VPSGVAGVTEKQFIFVEGAVADQAGQGDHQERRDEAVEVPSGVAGVTEEHFCFHQRGCGTPGNVGGECWIRASCLVA